jgi:hypothetical protein
LEIATAEVYEANASAYANSKIVSATGLDSASLLHYLSRMLRRAGQIGQIRLQDDP